jgi:predicted transcriptional regulator of viral defense system
MEAVVRDVLHRGWSGDRGLAHLAERQLGLVTRAQLTALGVGRGSVARRIEAGRLHRVHRGVYRVGHPSPLPFSRELAAVLAAGDGAALSHGSAAYAWALAPEPKGAVDITVPPHGRRTRAGIRAHRSMLPSSDITTCHGVPATTPARTLIDLASERRDVELERAVEDALRRRLVTRCSLRDALARAPRRPGAAALRAQLERTEGPALTRPAFHRGRAAFERDRARDAQLSAAGLRVMRVTWRQLADEPEAVVARLAAALATPASNACT